MDSVSDGFAGCDKFALPQVSEQFLVVGSLRVMDGLKCFAGGIDNISFNWNETVSLLFDPLVFERSTLPDRSSLVAYLPLLFKQSAQSRNVPNGGITPNVRRK